MCSRYSLVSPPERVKAHVGYANAHEFPPRPHIAPTEPVAIVRLSETRQREIALVRWGLIPAWAKNPSQISLMINVRAETVAVRQGFSGPIRHRRCLVPADAFYAWVGEDKRKRRIMIRRKDKGLLALAAIWEGWLGADGSEIDTMAILTVAGDANLPWPDRRMPAIIEPEAFEPWLDGRMMGHEAAAGLLKPMAIDCVEEGARDLFATLETCAPPAPYS